VVSLLFRFEAFLFFRDFGFNSCDHLDELDFAVLFSFGVDIEFLALTAGESWEEVAFPEVVAHLIQASDAALAVNAQRRLHLHDVDHVEVYIKRRWRRNMTPTQFV